jgi:predicted phage terminase large subunit-like protein
VTPEAARALFPTEREAQSALRMALRDVSVLDAIPIVRTGYERPEHLAPLASLYERAYDAAHGDGPPVRALVSAPSQVGKTTCGQVAATWWLNRDPRSFLAFLSYGQDIADIKSAEVRQDARELGIELRGDTTAKSLWYTKEGGGMLARGLDAGITGMSGLALIDLDDPYMNATQAESAAHKRRVERGYRSNVVSRIHPNTSVIIKHARWAPDDLIGTLEKEPGWESYRIAAVGDDGEPIVTMRGRDAAYWASQRAAMGEHAWWSLMQGLPRPREGSLFQGVHTYEHRPSMGQVVIGLDFAYSTRSSADYSVAVVLMRVDERAYVLDVVRVQESAPAFAARVKLLRARYSGAPMRAFIGGTERGTVDFFARDGLTITALPATGDKWSRAQSAASAWNAGTLLVPQSAPWVDAFVAELLDFSPRAAHDDQVDALVGAFDAASGGAAVSHLLQVNRPSLLGVASQRGRRGPW